MFMGDSGKLPAIWYSSQSVSHIPHFLWLKNSLVPRPRPKNRERGLVAFPRIFCRPLPLKILRSQSDCRMKPRGTWSHHMRTRPTVPTMQYCRVARDGVVSAFTGDRSKLAMESAVYPYGLSRQTPRSSVDTGFGPNQLRQSVGIFV